MISMEEANEFDRFLRVFGPITERNPGEGWEHVQRLVRHELEVDKKWPETRD